MLEGFSVAELNSVDRRKFLWDDDGNLILMTYLMRVVQGIICFEERESDSFG